MREKRSVLDIKYPQLQNVKLRRLKNRYKTSHRLDARISQMENKDVWQLELAIKWFVFAGFKNVSGKNVLFSNWSGSKNLHKLFVSAPTYHSPPLKVPVVVAAKYFGSHYCNYVKSCCHSLLHFMLKTNRISFIVQLITFSGSSHADCNQTTDGTSK